MYKDEIILDDQFANVKSNNSPPYLVILKYIMLTLHNFQLLEHSRHFKWTDVHLEMTTMK